MIIKLQRNFDFDGMCLYIVLQRFLLNLHQHSPGALNHQSRLHSMQLHAWLTKLTS